MGAAASAKKEVETTPLVQTAERVWTSAHETAERANDALFAFILWHTLKGVGGGIFFSCLPLYVTKLAGDPVRAAVFALYTHLASAAGNLLSGVIITPYADEPGCGRKPLLILGALGIAASLFVFAFAVRSLVALCATFGMLSFLYAELTVVVCVDCVSAGATAYQAFWRRFLGRYGEYGDVDIGGGSIPKRGSPRFITRVVGAYVAQIVCYEIGRQIGAGFGTAIAMNLSLEATGAVGGLIYLIAAVVGIFVLHETLEFAGEPEEHISHSPAEIWDTLWGSV